MHIFSRTVQTCKIVYSAYLYGRPKINFLEISQKLKTVISAIHLPISRRFSHCHFRKFTVNLIIFKTSIKTTRTLALTTNLDENIDKVSEKSHKIISLVSYLLAPPFHPLQTVSNKCHKRERQVNQSHEATILTARRKYFLKY